MITLNHVENPKKESPHLTILNFIMSAKSPHLLCKRRDLQGLGLGHGHLWRTVTLSTSGTSLFLLPCRGLRVLWGQDHKGLYSGAGPPDLVSGCLPSPV